MSGLAPIRLQLGGLPRKPEGHTLRGPTIRAQLGGVPLKPLGHVLGSTIRSHLPGTPAVPRLQRQFG